MNPGQYVVFTLDGSRFGLPIESVERILGVEIVVRVPSQSEFFLGVFDLRGETIPVLDTRRLLGLTGGESSCFLVISFGNEHAALTADCVKEIATFREDQIGPLETGNPLGAWVGRSDEELTLLLQTTMFFTSQAVLPAA